MILKYFLPDRDFSFEQLEKMSDKQPGMSTWPQAMLFELAQMDFDVKMIEAFDAEAFVQDGEKYLRRAFGEDTAEWQIKNSDIQAEQANYRHLLKMNSDIIEQRVPQLGEIRTFLQDGYLVNVVVNSRKLNGKSGYAGHSVVVYDIDDSYVTFHDPGLEPRQARQETLADFEAAWADPNDDAKSLIAIKYRG